MRSSHRSTALFGPLLAVNAAMAVAADTPGGLAHQSPARQPVVPLAQVMDLDPDERRAFFDMQLALHCGGCHSAEMIEQQRLTLSQWQGEVKKMLGWGATLPEDYASALADHLAALHPPEAEPRPSVITPAEVAALAEQPDDAWPVDPAGISSAGPLYGRYCRNCHGPDGEGGVLGPRLLGRAAIARRDSYHAVVEAGRGSMPALREAMSRQDAEAIRQWLLARSFSWE